MLSPRIDPSEGTEPRDVRSVLSRQSAPDELPERSVDMVLLLALLALLTLGLIVVFSSSSVEGLRNHGDSTFFLKRHLGHLGLGGGVLWLGAVTDYRWLERRTYLLLCTALALLVAVLFIGVRINAAQRWLGLGPLTFQPVELAKLALITYLAYSLGKKADKIKSFTVGFVPHLLVCALMVALLMKQPDMGSSIILLATTLTLLFVAGARILYLLFAVLAAAPVAYYFIVGTGWRMRRLLAYFNPEAFRQREAYQIVQSKIAVGSGGLSGVGLGEGRQTLGYMPEAHSDFILSSLGEELGFIGFAVVLLLFVVVLWRGVRAASSARDVFGSYLAFGITVSFALQAFVHSGVVLGLLPAKGLTLPFVSYGGSSLVLSMYLAGILLSVGRRPLAPPSRRRALVQVGVGARRRKQRAVIACDSS